MTGQMNEFEWLQWFLAENFGGQLKSVVANTDLALVNQTKLEGRIEKMNTDIQKKIDDLKAGIAADSEVKAKVLGEIKDIVAKLKDAQAGSEAAIAKAVSAAKDAQKAEDVAGFEAANKEVSDALASVQTNFEAGVAATKVLDAQIADLAPEPVPA